MKIGVDARNLVPSLTGIGRYVFEMCRELAQKGNDVFLYLPEEPSSYLSGWPGTTIHVGNYVGVLRRMVWAHTALPTLAAQDQVDVFWGPAHRLPRFLDRRIARVLTIHDLVWVHAAETMRRQSWLGDRLLMGPAVRTADRIVADSASTANAVKMLFPHHSSKVSVVYPGLTVLPDESSSDFLTSHQIDRPYALFVGTLEPRKNLLNLLEAYARMPEKTRRNLLLVIAGGQGWRLGDLKQHISRLGIAASVRLSGYISDAQLATLYGNARFLVMPSFYEGFGFPIIEANAAGIPVLTSDSSSMPEVAGDAAWFVDPGNIRSITDGLLRLSCDDVLRDELATRAKANAARFSWEQSADELVTVFKSAVESRMA